MQATYLYLKQLFRSVTKIPAVLTLMLLLCAMLISLLILGAYTGSLDRPVPDSFPDVVRMFGFASLLYVVMAMYSHFRQYTHVIPYRFFHITILTLTSLSFIGLLLVFYPLSVSLVFLTAQADWVARVSLWYFQMDNHLGVYQLVDMFIHFLMSEGKLLYIIINFAYSHTVTLVLLLVLLLPFFSFRIAWQYMLALVVTTLLSTPFWLLGPALAPMQLATTDSLQHTEYSGEIYEVTEHVRSLQTKYQETVWEKQTMSWVHFWEGIPDRGFGYAISSNPSMHIAWGVIVLIYIARLSRALGGIVLILLTAEAVGTVLFLQHYIIDIPAGALIGVLSVWLVSKYAKEPSVADRKFWFWIQYKMSIAGQAVIRFIRSRM